MLTVVIHFIEMLVASIISLSFLKGIVQIEYISNFVSMILSKNNYLYVYFNNWLCVENIVAFSCMQ